MNIENRLLAKFSPSKGPSRSPLSTSSSVQGGELDTAMGQRKGYKQTPEHIAKRKRFGPDHPGWKGDDVSPISARQRAQSWYEARPCEKCGNPKADRHHVDGNTKNNGLDNIRFLCRKCHLNLPEHRAAMLKAVKISLPKAVAAAAEKNRSRTHCINGHELSGDNLVVTAKQRICRECGRIRQREYQQRRKAKCL